MEGVEALNFCVRSAPPHGERTGVSQYTWTERCVDVDSALVLITLFPVEAHTLLSPVLRVTPAVHALVTARYAVKTGRRLFSSEMIF